MSTFFKPRQTDPATRTRPSDSRDTRPIDDLYDDLREARRVSERITDRTVRDRMQEILRRAERDTDRLDRGGRNDGGRGERRGATESEMATVLREVRNETFDSKKVTLIKIMARSQPFTCAQVGQILALFTFENDRADAAVALYPAIVDPGQFFSLRSSFTFNSKWNDVLSRLGLDR